jgi:hypothetical protein
MTTRTYRFQADIDPATGLFVSGQVFDEQMAADPITDVVTGTGRLLAPVTLTDQTHPELFDWLNAVAAKADERLTAARVKHREPAVEPIVDGEVIR